MVPPFDHPLIIAGQGTVGLEIVAQAKAVGAKLDAVLLPCGGGGLTAGCALALAELAPNAEVFAVEPEGFDDTAISLATGNRRKIVDGAKSFCDAILIETPGILTFSINRKHLTGGLVVSDEEVTQAMRTAYTNLKLVAEPGGAVALAAALTEKYNCRGKTVAVIVSGGNVDPAVFVEALGETPSG